MDDEAVNRLANKITEKVLGNLRGIVDALVAENATLRDIIDELDPSFFGEGDGSCGDPTCVTCGISDSLAAWPTASRSSSSTGSN